ncbi:sporulation/spore germination protein [filamentous cyanobacterium LEGE 11480]|uniref:Sporulation/spore germination protein n=1 Tax=Romeriopsis navalis LEGE 11480 TaxID=2777977 RepID=A0A928Z1Z0_9CYAN|nr:hypothetical protein [Romeriopsis navalis]MBE9028502.1 sporulation/spore germination protein [Romeriopsis navalis LEGE 11480]
MKQLLQWSITSVMLLSITACGSAPPNTNTESSNETASAPASPGVVASPSSSPQPRESASPKSEKSPTTQAKAPGNTAPNQSIPATKSPAPAPQTSPVKQIAASSSQQEITVYRLDNQCEDFVAQKVTVPQNDAPNEVVGKVIANSNGPDFKIENYRIRVNNGTATIDLRLPPDAKRPFTAMSTCEQRSLLGSMQKTLTSNPNLKINSVRFTDGKEELVF